MTLPVPSPDEEPRGTAGLVADVVAVLVVAAERARTLGVEGIGLLGDGADAAVSALVGARVQRAVDVTRPVAPATDLARALEPPSGAATVAAQVGRVSSRLARRSRLARAVTGRTPAGLALRLGPAVVDTVRGGVRAVDAVAATVAARARAAGVEPDPDRVRTVVVQALVGDPVDPDASADHARLALAWLARVGADVAPLGLGGVARRLGGQGPAAADVVAALDDLDPHRVGRG